MGNWGYFTAISGIMRPYLEYNCLLGPPCTISWYDFGQTKNHHQFLLGRMYCFHKVKDWRTKKLGLTVGLLNCPRLPNTKRDGGNWTKKKALPKRPDLMKYDWKTRDYDQVEPGEWWKKGPCLWTGYIGDDIPSSYIGIIISHSNYSHYINNQYFMERHKGCFRDSGVFFIKPSPISWQESLEKYIAASKVTSFETLAARAALLASFLLVYLWRRWIWRGWMGIWKMCCDVGIHTTTMFGGGFKDFLCLPRNLGEMNPFGLERQQT